MRHGGVGGRSRVDSTIEDGGTAVDDLEALRAEVKRLAEADRRKDDILFMLAHQLRNPLAPIVSAAEMMREPASEMPLVERYRGVIERQARNLTRIVDDLLDVSRIARGDITLRRQVTELEPILHSAVEAVRSRIEAGRHGLRVAVPVRSVRLFADPTRLEQIVVNLLDNAARYTPKGGLIRLTVKEEGGEVVLSVEDDGIGIQAELLPRVFDVFVQGERALDPTKGGLGIGLTLVKDLVEKHGGSVSASSEGPGRGSAFVVRIPVTDPALAARGEAPPARESGVRRRSRVLVVEDDHDGAQMMVDFLQRRGHEIRLAADASTAIHLADVFQPEIAVIDIGLPGVDGYEVARRLRRSMAGGIVLIALTGYGREHDALDGREGPEEHEDGFDHLLVKPANPEILARLVDGQAASPSARVRGWSPS